VALVGKIAIPFPIQSCSKSIVSYPEFTQRLILAWHYLGGLFHSLSSHQLTLPTSKRHLSHLPRLALVVSLFSSRFDTVKLEPL